MSRFTTNSVLLDTITADATSAAHDVSMRHKLSVEAFLDNALGSATIGFQVSNDGTNFITYNRIDSNVTDSNTQNDTRVATVTVDDTTPLAICLFPASDYFRYIKAVYTTVTGAIVTSQIGDGGTDYEVDDVLTVADGTGGTITVTAVDGSGAVTAYDLTTGGSAYTIATHAVTGGSGNDDFTLDVLTVNAGDFTATLQDLD